jgi:flagellar protein FlaG
MLETAQNVTGTTLQKTPQASEQIDTMKKKSTEDPANSQDSTSKNTLQSAELLKQIKALTEGGIYSVQFETDSSTGRMVVKVVDSSTQKVLRQIPPESLLGLDQSLTEFAGNFVDKKA